MLKIAIKSVGVWLVIVIAAIVNGAIREKLLTPCIGSNLSLPISGITLSVLVFFITYFAIVFFGDVKSRVYIFIGLFWIILTLAFEYLFGHYVMAKPWHEINQVFNVFDGNLFVVVLVVTALSPWAASKLKNTQVIHSVNSMTFPFSAQQIWESLADIPSYPLWWPSTLKIKILNASKDVIEIRPYGGLPFICEVSESVEPLKLVMKYSGIYSGLGVWTLNEINGRTKVDYEIHLAINNLFIRLLSYAVPIEKIHYKLMNEVLIGLEKRLG